MWQWLLMFILMLVWKWVTARYIRRVAQGRSFGAAFWGGKKWLLGMFIVIQYINDPWLVIPSYFGALIGTYWAVEGDKE